MKILSKEFENKIEKLKFSIEDLKNPRGDYYEGCNWWKIKYKYLDYSIYYDPRDVLGYFGEPYYEFYDNDDTYRFAALSETLDSDEILTMLELDRNELDKDMKMNPEKYL